MPLQPFWGSIDSFGTAAYWIDQAHRVRLADYVITKDFTEEVIACLLGGHGMPAEVGIAAFRAVRDSGLLQASALPAEDSIIRVLEQPLLVRGKTVRYRFPRQKGRYVAAALRELRSNPPSGDALEVRARLATIPGIGLKTASWIVRNWGASTQVAIIDVHVMRAGQAAGFLAPEWQLPRDYLRCEEAFLSFAASADISPIALDTCIWSQLHELRGLAPAILRRVNDRRVRGAPDSSDLATKGDGYEVLAGATYTRPDDQAAGRYQR